MTIVPWGSEESEKIGKITLNEVNKAQYGAKQVVEKIRAKGFVNVTMRDHTALWKELDAKNPGKGYGCVPPIKGHWFWFDRWIDRVIEHREQSGDRYK